jgi:hypothetical protein
VGFQHVLSDTASGRLPAVVWHMRRQFCVVLRLAMRWTGTGPCNNWPGLADVVVAWMVHAAVMTSPAKHPSPHV